MACTPSIYTDGELLATFVLSWLMHVVNRRAPVRCFAPVQNVPELEAPTHYKEHPRRICCGGMYMVVAHLYEASGALAAFQGGGQTIKFTSRPAEGNLAASVQPHFQH